MIYLDEQYHSALGYAHTDCFTHFRDTTLSDKVCQWLVEVCQWLVVGRWFTPGTYSGFLHHKTDSHDLTEILLKVALNTINPILILEYEFYLSLNTTL